MCRDRLASDQRNRDGFLNGEIEGLLGEPALAVGLNQSFQISPTGDLGSAKFPRLRWLPTARAGANRFLPSPQGNLSFLEETDSMEPIRQTVIFSGIVQGVGFRFNAAQQFAKLREQVEAGHRNRFDVSGTIENLVDRTVRLVLEGHPEDIEQLIRQISTTTGGTISNMEVISEPSLGEFAGFTIIRTR